MMTSLLFELQNLFCYNLQHVQTVGLSQLLDKDIIQSVCRYSHKVSLQTITKTYLYNLDPLKPHFYIVKLGFTGVYIIFLISAKNIDCGYSYPQSMFLAEI